MKALVPVANGSEEMEAVILIDTLRRAEFDVTVAGLTPGTVEASRGVKLVADAVWDEINPADYDMIQVEPRPSECWIVLILMPPNQALFFDLRGCSPLYLSLIL